VPSTLSNSTFLQDLTTLTHTDFVGQDVSPSALGLADIYTVSLLTLCGNDKTGTECTSPHFGFNFNPETDLKLSGTSIQDLLEGTLPSYVASFLGIAYVLSILLTFFALLVNLFTHSAGLALVSGIMSNLSTILLFATSIDSIVTFTQLNNAFNSVLSPFGAHSSLSGALFAISWVATAFSLATTILLYRSQHLASGGRGGRGALQDLKSEAERGPRSHRLLNRIPTWKIHEYRQINKKGVKVQNVGGARNTGAEDDFDPLVRNVGMEGAEDEHDMGPIDNEAPHRGIAMQVFRNEPQRNVDTIYEPFRES
jgi:hypothetical protein